MAPNLGELVTARDVVFQHHMKELDLDRDAVKKAMLTLTYIGQPICEPTQWMLDYRNQLEKLAKHLVHKHPDKMPFLADRRRPWVSLLSFVSSDLQRGTTDAMIQAAGEETVASHERDAIVVRGIVDKGALQAAANIPLTFSGYPTEKEIMEMCKKKWPYHNWELKSYIKMEDVHRARACCLRIVWGITKTDGKGKETVEYPTPDNTTDFGTVVAYTLEDRLIIGKKAAEFFDHKACKYGRWVVVDKEELVPSIVRDALGQEFRRTCLELVDGKYAPQHFGPVPPCTKRRGFYMSVAQDTKLALTRRVPAQWLDGSWSRQFLMDNDGLVYDFQRGSFFAAHAHLRLRRHLPWSFNVASGCKADDVWKVDPAIKKELVETLDRIIEFWLLNKKPLQVDAVLGIVLYNKLKTFIQHEPKLALLRLLLPTFDGDVDSLLWYLLHFAGDACAFKRRTEMRYFYGAGATGKDCLHCLSLSFFGDGQASRLK